MTADRDITVVHVYKEVQKLREAMNGRMRSLEISRGWMKGALAVISVIIVPIAIAVIVMMLNGKFTG